MFFFVPNPNRFWLLHCTSWSLTQIDPGFRQGLLAWDGPSNAPGLGTCTASSRVGSRTKAGSVAKKILIECLTGCDSVRLRPTWATCTSVKYLVALRSKEMCHRTHLQHVQGLETSLPLGPCSHKAAAESLDLGTPPLYQTLPDNVVACDISKWLVFMMPQCCTLLFMALSWR